jgi:hypothetical protein
MSKSYIQLARSEKVEWLLATHPNAFLLLTLIALRARRTRNSPDGLEIGECHIGDYEKAGIESREKYRNALELLEKLGTIKKVETCRTRKKATSGTTTKGTKVKLLNSEFYDINMEIDNHQSNHRATTEQPPSNHEQECNNVRMEKKQQPQTPKGTCVVFSCLEKINDLSIDQKEKERLTRKNEGNEQVVINAVAAILQSSFTPERSLLISLRAAIKGQWKPLPEKEDNIKINKKKALELEMKGHPNFRVDACNTFLEIIAGPISRIVQYDLSPDKFDKQVLEHLKTGKQA